MMQIEVLKSKIHRATVTDAKINYVGRNNKLASRKKK